MIYSETLKPLAYDIVPSAEIFGRISRLQERLARAALDGAIIVDIVNLFYFTGTIQQGVLFVPQEGDALFFIRRSLERAERETPIKGLIPIKRFNEMVGHIADAGRKLPRLGLDETTIPVSVFKKVSGAFQESAFEDIGFALAMIRAVKSDYEVELIREAGRRHKLIYDKIPDMISGGITEWELGSAILAEMLKLGFTGVGRLATFNSELFGGVISFGDSGNYPTSSVGPDGLVGLSPAFPLLGGARRLKRDEIIFVDTGFSYHGYNTDKTRIFCLGNLPQAALDAHKTCLDIQEALRWRLKPGAIPGEIFDDVYEAVVLTRNFDDNFMGFGTNKVPFLGHGIGLVFDEYPAIARKIRTPLEENMVIALEPKKGLEGIGLVGIENTFLVTEQGGEKLTIGSDEIALV